jgi:uncharacterized Fe-S cluster protein YjdI
MAIHEHKGDGFTVTFDPDVCTHAGRCVKGLPAVFDSKRKPWIDPSAATADEIAAQIARCPSRALGFSRDEA